MATNDLSSAARRDPASDSVAEKLRRRESPILRSAERRQIRARRRTLREA